MAVRTRHVSKYRSPLVRVGVAAEPYQSSRWEEFRHFAAQVVARRLRQVDWAAGTHNNILSSGRTFIACLINHSIWNKRRNYVVFPKAHASRSENFPRETHPSLPKPVIEPHNIDLGWTECGNARNDGFHARKKLWVIVSCVLELNHSQDSSVLSLYHLIELQPLAQNDGVREKQLTPA